MKKNNQPGNQVNNQPNGPMNNQPNGPMNNQPTGNFNNQMNSQTNTTMSALDALNKQLEIEASMVPSPPPNAKKIVGAKNSIKPKPKPKSNSKSNSNSGSKKPTVSKTINKKSITGLSKPSNNNDKVKYASMNDLDEEIKKLELELGLAKNKSPPSKPNSPMDKNIVESSELVESKDDQTGNEIAESKKALIKLLLDAKRNKSSGDLNTGLALTPTLSDGSDPINDNKEDDNKEDQISRDDNGFPMYQENFNIGDYDNYAQNEEQVMNIEFNDPLSAKLIKVIDDEDNNYTVPPNVKIRSTNPNNSFAISRNNVGNLVKGSIDFDINSSAITSYDCYNDYMVDLPNPMTITDIKIKDMTMPKNSTENINRTNNELKIIIDNREQIFELEENYYNRYEIKEFLNEAFSAYNYSIQCDIQEGVFVFMSDKKFTMINHETSILPTLGFNRMTYVNRDMYSAENSHRIGDNIFYLVIENISEHPLFCINNDTNEITKLQDFPPVKLDHLIIKFYKTNKDLVKNDKDYNFFFNTHHLITFELVM